MSALVPFASQRLPRLSRHVLASAGYTLAVDDLAAGTFEVWDANTARRQNRAWRPLIDEARAGNPRRDIEALGEALAGLPSFHRVLEVGCGGGYLSEVILDWYPDVEYLGVDLSPAMIAVANEQYPTREFIEASAYDLPVESGGFDVVIDGVALIHMANWRAAIGQYARASSHAVVLHGLTLTDEATTTRFAKYAYGQPTVEFVFGREEVVEACESAGLKIHAKHASLEYDLQPFLGIPTVSETWVLTRTS